MNESPASEATAAAISNNEESNFRSADSFEYDSLLATIEGDIGTDEWQDAGGTNRIEPSPSSVVACAPEDIFGSRAAYLKMFDDSTRQVVSENDPLGVAEDGDPLKTSADQ